MGHMEIPTEYATAFGFDVIYIHTLTSVTISFFRVFFFFHLDGFESVSNIDQMSSDNLACHNT